ncbi:MAG TPA: cell envelope integrity protein TolA [Thermoanaerobaculia bacterium]|jgi:hypothetical protein|nr:cell envelope integrity protein TolA [Thermoanaerobaculia bacterium]
MAEPSSATGLGSSIRRFAPALLLLVALVTLVAPLLPAVRGWTVALPRVAQWLVLILTFCAFLAVIGRQVNGKALGVLIDTRNKMSLSRLQITLWTMLVLSAYAMIATPRIFGKVPDLKSLPADDQRRAMCKKALGREPRNVADCEDSGPLQITFPPELLWAMGISVASFAGSSLIQNAKKNKEINIEAKEARLDALQRKRVDAAAALADAKDAVNAALKEKTDIEARVVPVEEKAKQERDQAVQAAETQTDEEVKQAAKQAAEATLEKALMQPQALKKAAAKNYDEKAAVFEAAQEASKRADEEYDKTKAALLTARTEAEGVLHKNADPAQARWSDLFSGDEIGNHQLVDLGKVQMCFFTVVIILAYGAAVGALLGDVRAIHPLGVDFPPFSNSLNALLGISHGTYLSVKGVDQTKTAS